MLYPSVKWLRKNGRKLLVICLLCIVVGWLAAPFLFAQEVLVKSVETVATGVQNWTSQEWLLIIAALGVFVTTLGGVLVNAFVSIRNGQKTEKVADLVAENTTKTEGVAHQVQEVHTLTNSNLSLVKSELATAAMQISQLREVVADLKSERGKVAATAANAQHESTKLTAALLPVPLPIESPILKDIEKNTADTAENTARTEESAARVEGKVDELKK